MAGVPAHVMQRGNNRATCFRDDRDRTLYLGLLQEFAQRHQCLVHAYVLMDNHVHLLATPVHHDGLSQMMKQVGQRYAQFVNRRYGRSGSLWEGRFKSSLVDSDVYLMRCYRYVELNPVRAGMVADPTRYPWSSYRANAFGDPSPIVMPHENYLALGVGIEERRRAYRDMVDIGLTQVELEEIRAAIRGGFALGSEKFLADLRATSRRRPVAGRPGRPAAQRDTSATEAALFAER